MDNFKEEATGCDEHRIRGLGARDGKEVDSWGPAEQGRIPYDRGPRTGAEWH